MYQCFHSKWYAQDDGFVILYKFHFFNLFPNLWNMYIEVCKNRQMEWVIYLRISTGGIKMISAISVFVLHVEVETLDVKFNLLSFSLAIKYDVSGVYINGIETAVWNLLNYIMLQAKANRLYSSGHICHIVIYKKYFSDWKEMKRVVFGIWFCTNIQSTLLFEFAAAQTFCKQ